MDEEPTNSRGTILLILLAVVAGVAIGLVGGGFRLGLDWADIHRANWIVSAKALGPAGWILPVIVLAALAALARSLVRLAPLAAGSGVQHVEAVMRGEAERAPWLVVPIKFVGGLLAIGGGLALGREGPTVQMGATLGSELAARCRRSVGDLRDLQAALAGAGLAVAFNAPIGGALFVFEEVARSFRLQLTVLTLVATAVATAVARVLTGDSADFAVARVTLVPWSALLACVVLGGILGIFGVLYNRVTILAIDSMARIAPKIPETRAALIGGIVGLIGGFVPGWVGGGDPLNQSVLDGQLPALTLLAVLAVRWFIGPLSYAAGTPGGLFAPLLLVGSAAGYLFALGASVIFANGVGVEPASLAVIGMAAFFTGVVRAPLTSVVLIAEMTNSPGLLIPLAVASASAAMVATMLKGPPIYDTLRSRMLDPNARR